MELGDAQLSVALAKLAAQRQLLREETATEAEKLLLAVTAFHDLARASSDLQGQAVRAAHEAGVSWAKIGELLGTSRQAVQQRFDPRYLIEERTGPSIRILGPVDRAEEMHHLETAAARGWKLVRARHGEHELEHTHQAWEITRVSLFSPRPMPAASEGWEAAATRFPDCFYVRPAR